MKSRDTKRWTSLLATTEQATSQAQNIRRASCLSTGMVASCHTAASSAILSPILLVIQVDPVRLALLHCVWEAGDVLNTLLLFLSSSHWLALCLKTGSATNKQTNKQKLLCSTCLNRIQKYRKSIHIEIWGELKTVFYQSRYLTCFWTVLSRNEGFYWQEMFGFFPLKINSEKSLYTPLVKCWFRE